MGANLAIRIRPKMVKAHNLLGLLANFNFDIGCHLSKICNNCIEITFCRTKNHFRKSFQESFQFLGQSADGIRSL